MGASQSSKQLVIATLNYSGILLSPFEFYSTQDSQQLSKISQCFKDLLLKTRGSMQQWKIGQIDKKTQKQRYTPIYRKQAGIQNGKLITQTIFKQRWQQQFEKILKMQKFKQKPTLQEIQTAMKFDLHCYNSILQYLRKKKNYNNISLVKVQQYQQLMNQYFSKSFINQQRKQTIIIQAILAQNIDVFFLQQASQNIQRKLKKLKFTIFKQKDTGSLIVLNPIKFNKFYNLKQILSHLDDQKYVKQLNWNQDTSMCMADNFIFICVHLSSKKQRNSGQIQKLINDLDKLRKIYPMCQIIVGGDLNSYLCPQLAPTKYYIYPDDDQLVTTSKCRTLIQPQIKKANQLSREIKDSLISTLPLINPKVLTISGQDAKNTKYIPNQAHPCDHYVVAAKIRLNY